MPELPIIFLTLLISLFVLGCFQKKEPTLIITCDFGSVRACRTLEELEHDAQILISARPDIVTLDACSPDLVNYKNSVGFFIEGSPFDALFEQGHEPYGLMVDALKQHPITVLANVRMNDHHGRPNQWTPWEREHVAWSLFEDTGSRDWKAIGRLRHLDYAIAGVREYRLSILQEIMDRFNVDGLQLDFGRTAPFVSEPKLEKAKYLTEYIQQVRQMLEKTARARNRDRMLLGVLVPWDAEFCRTEGLDIPAWIQQGLIDYVSPGEWYYADWNLPLAPWKKMTDGTSCRLYPFTPGNVSPYQVFEYGEPSLLGENRILAPAQIRAIADNFAYQEPDGFAFYNFYTHDFGDFYPELRTWVNPELSPGQSRHYFNCRKLVYHATEKETFDEGIAFVRTKLSAGQVAEFPFRFGTSLNGQRVWLKMVFKNATALDKISVRLNGVELEAHEIEERTVTGKNQSTVRVQFWSGEIPVAILKPAENSLQVELESSPDNGQQIEAGEFEIWVAAIE